ncbi:hypothetical protein AURDEDRAFT_118171 [Auricularia subglabra TFB-10046 SS5]|uniref:Uncharacterized protein n=1 Tax=Auricularia subglabra (strain TFB-10046 / SS5) TaxID=717982 RepID=J0L7H7_AURST|nr:hypothetical protein AURDEDRAFT_118171 [Auricularia subglabra TFB-10046 SS5]
MPAAPRTGCGRVRVPQAMFASPSGRFVPRGHAPSSARTRPIDTAVQLAPGVRLEVPASHNDRSIVRATQSYVACGHGSRLPRLTDLRPGSRRRDDRGPTASSRATRTSHPRLRARRTRTRSKPPSPTNGPRARRPPELQA